MKTLPNARAVALLALLLPAASFAETGFWELLTNVDPTQVKAIASEHLGLALALCFASGMLTSFTPCVYPMIPITINIFGRASQQSGGRTFRGFNPKVFGLAVVYVAGMCATYSVMGMISGLTGSLFGGLLQSSFMLAFLAILFLTLALSQFGLFKLSLPASWQNKMLGVGNTNSRVGIFIMGAISGLIVSPCVGPIVAGILAFVFESSNALLGTLYFFSFSLGLGVLFLVIGGFSGVLNQLPRSGKWMNLVNRLLAVLLLIAAAYYGILWMKKMGWVDKGISATSTQAGQIAWINDEKTALDRQASEKLPLILDFTAEWCAACHEIEHQVFNQTQAQDALKSFVPLRIDVTEENEANSAILRKYGVMSLPTVVFLNAKGEVLSQPRIHGVIPVEKFLALLEEVRSR